MSVMPHGWVTVDAREVGGPEYLKRLAGPPRWQIVHHSGSTLGDVVVRKEFGLQSAQVAVLWLNDIVEQNGLMRPIVGNGADGVLRLPVSFTDESKRTKSGWITADATSAGGPVFVKELCEPESGGPAPFSWDASPS